MNQETDLKYGTILDFNKKNYNKRFVFVLNHHNPTPGMVSSTGVGKHFPNSVILPLIDEIFDKTAGRKRIIRYIPGEASIFVDEQSPDDKFPKQKYFLQFDRSSGDIVVDGKETKKLEFMLKCNFNGSNPERDETKRAHFWMVDLGVGLKELVEKDKRMHEAKQWCYTAGWDDIKSYARVKSLDVKRDPDEVRWALIMLAEKDPETFLKGLNNDLTKRKHHILEALDRGILTVNPMTNSISWSNGGVIIIAPLGKEPIDHLVDLTLSVEGELTYKAIKDMLKPEIQAAKQETKISADPPLNVSAPALADLPPVSTEKEQANLTEVNAIKSEIAIEDWVALALQKKVIRKSGPWYKFGQQKWSGQKSFIEAITADAELKKQIEVAIYS